MLANYHEIKILVRYHQNQIDEDIKDYRLMKKIKPSQPKIKDRLLLSLGRHLIAAGSKLQKRAKSDFAPCHGDYQVC